MITIVGKCRDESLTNHLTELAETEIFPEIERAYPELKDKHFSLDLTGASYSSGDYIDIFANVCILEEYTDCIVHGAVLKQSSYCECVGFTDYYKIPNTHLFAYAHNDGRFLYLAFVKNGTAYYLSIDGEEQND